MKAEKNFRKNAAPRTSLPVAGVVKNLSDAELLDVVQRQTLRYFWDNAHPGSGMARERTVKGAYTLYDTVHTVTTGGTGFGVMAMLAGVERGWLRRAEVCAQVTKIVDFLERAETFNGVFPHFLDGRTGKANFFETLGSGENRTSVPQEEKGANIVETAFLFMGLLSARQYFSRRNAAETALRGRINKLWEAVEWDSHLSADGRDLQWLNHPAGKGVWPVTGWNEALVTHVMAASSPTHPVKAEVYHQGWCSGKDYFRNGRRYYGHDLPLGPPAGGPLFFAHYSFLGLDPRGLKDRYADYWRQNRNHTLINRAYCVENPGGHKGYGPDCWGLTASDNPGGYNVHRPDDAAGTLGASDDGTIAPTAALSSFPYAPDLAMRALRHFYEGRGAEIWKEYGFADAFNPGMDWVADGHLAIDQGPIVVMIENHRSGLLWGLFMSCPEIRRGLDRLGFERGRGPAMGPKPA